MIKITKDKPSKKQLITTTVIAILSVLIVIVSTAFGVLCYKYIHYNRATSTKEITEYTEKEETTDKTEDEKFNSNIEIIESLKNLINSNGIYTADNDLLFDYLLTAYLESTGDPYCRFYSPEDWIEENNTLNGTSVGIGSYVYYSNNIITVTHVMTGSPAEAAGIQKGDIILGTDEVDFSTLSYSDSLAKIKGEAGTTVTLKIQRGDEIIYIDVTRKQYNTQTVITYNEEYLGKKYTYIKIVNFYASTVTEFQNALLNAKENNSEGLIIDLRDNTGGLLSSVTSMLDMLLPECDICHVNFKDESKSYTITSSASQLIDLPITILTNGSTASAAELFTSCLHDYELATIVGTKTYGKGCGQSQFMLSNGYVVYITTFLYSPPLSENYNDIGIYPDVEVSLSEDAEKKSTWLLTDEEDTQLKAALNSFFSSLSE